MKRTDGPTSVPGWAQLNIEAAGLTDVGLVRRNNEDSIFVFDSSDPNVFRAPSYGIYLVADGMGGHRAGEIASDMAMRTISTRMLESLGPERRAMPPVRLLKESIEVAHAAILSAARERPDLQSMGTTVTVGLRLGADLYIGHVGDSRAYLIRQGKIRQLTEDHSVVGGLLRAGAISAQEAATHPDRGKILRCLGVSRQVAVDTRVQDCKDDRLVLQPGDCVLFCSDGLTGHVRDDEMLAHAQNTGDPRRLTANLVDLANSRGGEDNTSVIAVKVCGV